MFIKKILKNFSFFLVTCYLLLFTSSVYAAEPGLNLINNPNSQFYVPQQSTFNWLLFTPNSPQELSNWEAQTHSAVIRIHSAWTAIGRQMLGSPQEQQQAAQSWCQAINSISGVQLYIEPFNELEQDYERLDPSGQTLSLTESIFRAKRFIALLQNCLTKGTITSPAMDPQSASFPYILQAFSDSAVLSCHPYRLDTVDTCINAAGGKPMIFSEIGVDKNGVVYDDCEFIDLFCNQGFIGKLNSIPNLLAYFLFTFSPGNYDGSWQLTNQSVVSALKNQCTGNLSCTKDTDAKIEQIINNVRTAKSSGNAAPLPARGIYAGPSYYSNGHGFFATLRQVFSNWLDKLLGTEGTKYPFNFRAKEQYVEDVDPNSGDMRDMVKIVNPNTTVTDKIASIMEGSTQTGLLISHANDISTSTSKEYANTVDKHGSGKILSVESEEHIDFFTKEGKSRIKKAVSDLETGISTRITSYDKYSDIEVDKILCQLATSADPYNPYFIANPDQRLFDEALGYLEPVTETSFTLLPIGGSAQTFALPDRVNLPDNIDSVPIKISTIFCTNKNLNISLDKCIQYGFGSINPNVCSATPDWLMQEGLEGPIFRTFYPRLRYNSLFMTKNASNKAFIQRCQGVQAEECSNLKNPNTYIGGDFDSFLASERTDIIDNKGGAFFKSEAAQCYACKVDMFFLTNLTKALQTIGYTSKMTSSYKYTQNPSPVATTIYHSSEDIDAGVYTPDPNTPLGIDNRNEKYSYTYGATILDKVKSFFSRLINHNPCQVGYITDDQGNTTPSEACQISQTSVVTNTLYLSQDAYQFVQATEQFNSNILPYQTQTKLKNTVKKVTGQDQMNTLYDMDYSTTNQGSRLETAQEMFGRKVSASSVEYLDDSTKTLAGPPNTTVQTELANLQMLPYSWQQHYSSQSSTSYQNSRPDTYESIDTNLTPNTDFCQYVSSAAQTNNLDPSLVAALISVESHGNSGAISNCGAIGLMQVMPNNPDDYWQEPCKDKFDPSIFRNRPTAQQLLDPQKNINYGTDLLNNMIKYWGSLEAGLTHYGPTGYDGYANLVLSVQSKKPTACQ